MKLPEDNMLAYPWRNWKSLLVLAVLTTNSAGHAASSGTTLSVGAIKPMFDGGTVSTEGSGQGGAAGQTLPFTSGNTSAPLPPGEPVTQTVTLTVNSYENAPPTQSSTLSVTLPSIPGVQFSFKVNGQSQVSAAMSGSVKLEFQVEATSEDAAPLSGIIVATITAN